MANPYITGTVGNHFPIGALSSPFGNIMRSSDERFSSVTQFILRAKKLAQPSAEQVSKCCDVAVGEGG